MPFTAGQRVTAAELNGNTIQLVDSASLSASTASVVLNLPAGYNRAKLYWRARSAGAVTAEPLMLQFNGDSGAHYQDEIMQTNNTTVAGTTATGQTKMQIATIVGASGTSNYFSSGSVDIDGVSDTTNFKTAVGQGTAFVTTSNMYVGVYGGQWIQAAAVTTVTLFANANSLASGSTFSLYGLT